MSVHKKFQSIFGPAVWQQATYKYECLVLLHRRYLFMKCTFKKKKIRKWFKSEIPHIAKINKYP